MFCSTIKTKVKSLLRQFDNFVDAHVDMALTVTTNPRNFLASPVADAVTALIPGNLEAGLKNDLVMALNKAIQALTILDSCKQVTDLNGKIKCFAQQVQTLSPDLQDAVLQKLASLMSGNLDGSKLKQNLYDLYTQAKYSIGKQ